MDHKQLDIRGPRLNALLLASGNLTVHGVCGLTTVLLPIPAADCANLSLALSARTRSFRRRSSSWKMEQIDVVHNSRKFAVIGEKLSWLAQTGS